MKRFLEKCLICILVMTMMSNFIMSIPVSFAYVNEHEILIENKMVQGEKRDYRMVSPEDRPGYTPPTPTTPYAPGLDPSLTDPEPEPETDPTPSTSGGGILDIIGGMLSGLVGLLTWVPRLLFISVATGLNAILTAFVVIGGGDLSGVEGATGVDDFFVTPFHIFFNKIPLLDVNFLNLDTDNTTVKTFRQAVAGWYYTMRLISSMVLLVILVYIGIRMTLSTIASEKAMYKKMLVDWVCSLVILFLLHYIMIFTFACNDALVNAMAKIAEGTDMTTFMTNLSLKALNAFDAVMGFAAIIVYCMVVFQTLSFILAYIKRMLTIGFLIIIAPLITITYSIDKIGDGKAQALNTWLKEFVYNILIQPFHCILFLSFAKVAMDLLAADLSASDSSLATAVLAILCIQYIKTGEELVKKIFGFEKAGSLSTLAAGAAMSMAAISKGKSAGKVVGGVAAKGVRLAKKGIKSNSSKIKDSRFVKTTASLASGAKTAIKNSAIGTAVAGATAGFMSDMKRKKDARKEEKIQKQMEKDLGSENYQKLVAGQDSPEGKKAYDAAREKAAQQVAEKSNKGQKISGAVSKAGRFVANTGKSVASSDVGQFLKKNSGKIAGKIVGGTLAFAGLANGASGMMAGYNVGSGLVEGYLANSAGTTKKELNGLIQASTNMDGEGNTEQKMLMIKAMGDSEGFKDIGKKLDELKNQLNKLGITNNQSQMAWGNIHKQLTLDPASVNRDTIRNALEQTDNFDKLSPEQQDAAVELMANHTNFMAQASIYNSMKNAEGLGYDIPEMAAIVGNKTPDEGSYVREQTSETQTSTYESTENSEVDTKEVELNIQEFANNFVDDLAKDLNKDVSDINAQIALLNRMLTQFESANSSEQQQIANAINAHSKVESSSNDFANPEQVKIYLNNRINELQNNS